MVGCCVIKGVSLVSVIGLDCVLGVVWRMSPVSWCRLMLLGRGKRDGKYSLGTQ